MTRLLSLAALALAATMLVPPGVATWASYGSLEPDNKYDLGSSTTWQDPPGQATSRVYFNVVSGEAGLSLLASPNSATLGGRVYNVGNGGFEAILGVWADCNHDGYVGMADGALREYRVEAAEALGQAIDESICPPMPDDAADEGRIHNGGGWITELLPISPVDLPPGDAEHRYLNASASVDGRPGTAIWGDRIEPRAPDAPPAFDACKQSAIAPSHRQEEHTGGLLQHADCLDGRAPDAALALAQARDPTGATQALPQPSALWADGAPLDVDEPGTDQACKGDPANPPPQPCPQGNNAIVYGEFDCSAAPLVDQTVTVPDATGLVGGDITTRVVVYSPGTPQVNPDGTAPATVNETIEENALLDDCDGTDDFGHDVYQGTDGTDAVTTAGKSAPELEFRYGFKSREACTDPEVSAPGGGPSASLPVGAERCGAPDDLGVVPGSHALSFFEVTGTNFVSGQQEVGNDAWDANHVYVNSAPRIGGASVDASGQTKASLDLAPADWYTFFARTTLSGVAFPGAGGLYGAEFCAAGIGRNAPATNGWVCDPSLWNLDTTTGRQDPGLAQVGDPFQLRDVDCYDSSVVSRESSLNPTGEDLGPRSAAPLTDPAHGCW